MEGQAIAKKAAEAGYDAIKYNAHKGSGTNLAIIKNFDEILKPLEWFKL